MTPPRSDCTHTTRFISFGGEEACEMCARIDSGWKECKDLGCRNLVPPDERRCEIHHPANYAECPDCGGDGDVECEESNCHGEFCEDGYVYCDTCGGEGEVQAEEAA